MSDPKLPPAGEPGKANGTAMLFVGCKLPNGLVCELGAFGDESYRQVRLNGSNSSRIAGGFGLTEVSADFWNAWMKKYSRLEFVRKGLVFSHSTLANATAHAEEFKAAKTGLEPLDPLKKVIDPATGATLLEVDSNHFAQARRDVAQARQRAQ